jgi:hypothetical protein
MLDREGEIFQAYDGLMYMLCYLSQLQNYFLKILIDFSAKGFDINCFVVIMYSMSSR